MMVKQDAGEWGGGHTEALRHELCLQWLQRFCNNSFCSSYSVETGEVARATVIDAQRFATPRSVIFQGREELVTVDHLQGE